MKVADGVFLHFHGTQGKGALHLTSHVICRKVQVQAAASFGGILDVLDCQPRLAHV